MRNYYIDSKKVSEIEFREAAAINAGCDLILKTQQIPKYYKPPEIKQIISPERARELKSMEPKYCKLCGGVMDLIVSPNLAKKTREFAKQLPCGAFKTGYITAHIIESKPLPIQNEHTNKRD